MNFFCREKKKRLCQEWDSNPRLHLETRTPALVSHEKDIILESGALDRSAILTTHRGEVNFQYLLIYYDI